MSDWSVWGIVILMGLAFLTYDIARREKEKIFIKVYEEKTSKEGRKSFSELTSIGEFKGDFFNTERRCYEFQFKKNFAWFNVFSNYTMTQLMEVHKIERVYLVYYSLNCYLFEKKVAEPYYKDLGWSKQAQIYNALCFLFDLTPSGIICSLLIFGSIFYLAMPFFYSGVLIGCGVGLSVSVLNYQLKKTEKVKETLLKKRTQLVEKEYYMSPLESDEEIIDIYEVKGTIQEEIMNPDGVAQVITKKLRDDNNEDSLIIKRYDELYDLQRNPLVTIESSEIISQERRKRTPQEMMQLKRSYLSRNKAMTEDVFRLQAENERLQRNYRDQEVQMQHVLETKDKEIKEMSLRMIKEQTRQQNTLKKIMGELRTSEFVGLNFDQTLLKCLRIINQEEQATKADKMDKLIEATGRMFELIAQKTNVDLNELMKLLKNEGASENATKEGT